MQNGLEEAARDTNKWIWPSLPSLPRPLLVSSATFIVSICSFSISRLVCFGGPIRCSKIRMFLCERIRRGRASINGEPPARA
jgi:hypothetical protein